jgi:hypothetical protein
MNRLPTFLSKIKKFLYSKSLFFKKALNKTYSRLQTFHIFKKLTVGVNDPSVVFLRFAILGLLVGLLISSASLQYYFKFQQEKLATGRLVNEGSLRTLLIENTVLLTEASKSLINNHIDEDAIRLGLDANIREIVKNVGSIYGESAAQPLFDLLKKQNDEYLHYTSDMYGGFVSNAQNELPALTGFPEKFASFFSDINPQTNKAQLKDLAGSYVSDVKTFVDAYLVRDYTTAYSKERDLINKADAISFTLIRDASLEHPEKFSK